ncbi:branched-chain amino acid ABC transporter permease [Siccirubricoccus sp. KC 17139]|uniref:Branched-chain amino acid ABC transporter permease n=1 Tax=Siccirubricoccus soli TaxID=2899147 RepID=A0ABT1D1E2_9PROT|nr:branched-chain amino acid ABC transporter permease [Siccirubricoccus soli]MCO6415730.1 branched-chain amino acid ABC transporter permease [Siccirubricoccus soli]MCP2681862.1 branched-chain amino acid ABC transporter permease [Siccirubricoccus soli]
MASDTTITAGAIAASVKPGEGVWGFSRAQLIALGVLVVFLAVAPFVLYPVFLMKLLCFALFACAFNLLIGYVGLLSFGHAAYFGMGGYLAGHAAKVWGLSPELAIIIGGATAALLGAVAGWIAIRRQGIYFAMITLALAQMVYFFCVQAPFTGGEDGIQAIPRGRLFGVLPLDRDMNMYWMVVAVFLGGFLLIHRIIHSPYGQVLKSIRENEPRATSLGYRTDDYKLLAFILSATLAGVAGATKSLVFGIATLTDVHWAMSGEVVLMTLVGGLGTVFGPLVGAAVIVTMQNYLAEMGAWVTVIQGVIFVACVLAFRRGVVGEIASLLKVKL